MPRLVGKRAMKRPNAVPRMTAEEKRLAREMHFDRGFSRAKIAEALGRGQSSAILIAPRTVLLQGPNWSFAKK